MKASTQQYDLDSQRDDDELHTPYNIMDKQTVAFLELLLELKMYIYLVTVWDTAPLLELCIHRVDDSEEVA